MASDPVSDHRAIIRVPDRTPAPLSSLAERTLATLRDSEASVETSKQVDRGQQRAKAGLRGGEWVEFLDEDSATGWQCPTHHKRIEKVSRAGRTYAACPDCDEFERPATPPPDSWWASLSDDEEAVLRERGRMPSRWRKPSSERRAVTVSLACPPAAAHRGDRDAPRRGLAYRDRPGAPSPAGAHDRDLREG